jgi:predicted DNA-binding transcriptional regulator AlpA
MLTNRGVRTNDESAASGRVSSPPRIAPAAGPDIRAALRVLAEALPPSAVVPVPRETLLDLLDVHAPCVVPATAPTPDRLLSAEEAAQLLGVSPRWLYQHGARQSFTHKLGRRTVRYSERGLMKWKDRQRGDRAP